MYALLVTLGSFALILFLSRLKAPLPAAILTGGIVCGLGMGITPVELLVCLGSAAVKPKAISLAITVGMLLSLSSIMRTGGQMDRIVDLAKQLVRRPVVAMAALPALIGMLPMPGGALFSAPMVESAAGGQKVSPSRLSAVNYWFRHVWECWWPLFPGLILAATITEQSLALFFVFQFPLSLAMIVAGLGMFRGMHPNLHAVAPRPSRGAKRSFIKATSSIWVVLLAWLAVRGAMLAVTGDQATGQDESPSYWQLTVSASRIYLPVMAGIAVSLVVTLAINRPGASKLGRTLREAGIPKMVVLVLSVVVFQAVLERADAPARIGKELTDMHVPIVAVFAILPFIAGMVTGLAIGFVGTSFPILMGLLDGGPDVAHGPYIALAYLFGHMGQMVSPLHLCQIVSNRYFKTNYAPVYRQVLPAVVVTVVLGLAYIALLMLLVN